MRCSSTRAIFCCRVINVWNSFPDTVSITSLSTFKWFKMVDFFIEFLVCNNE